MQYQLSETSTRMEVGFNRPRCFEILKHFTGPESTSFIHLGDHLYEGDRVSCPQRVQRGNYPSLTEGQ